MGRGASRAWVQGRDSASAGGLCGGQWAAAGLQRRGVPPSQATSGWLSEASGCATCGAMACFVLLLMLQSWNSCHCARFAISGHDHNIQFSICDSSDAWLTTVATHARTRAVTKPAREHIISAGQRWCRRVSGYRRAVQTWGGWSRPLR